jgi:hypothetical protein
MNVTGDYKLIGESDILYKVKMKIERRRLSCNTIFILADKNRHLFCMSPPESKGVRY